MTDLAHVYGGDLAWSPAGDVALVTGSAEGRQRVLRRVLTIAGNYIWQPNYGGSAPALVGTLTTPKQVEAAMLAQMLLEACVAQSPPPSVVATMIPNGVNVSISYTDAATADPVIIGFSLT